MKKTLVALAILILTAPAAIAQTTGQTPISPETRQDQGQGRDNLTAEQRADRQAQHLTKQLSLSTDQATQVRAITLAENQEMQALRTKFATAGSRRGAGQELKATQEKYDAQLKAILTADQAAKFNQLRAEQQSKRREKMKEGGMKARS